MSEKFYFLKEAAQILRMGYTSFYRMRKEGKIKISRDAGGRKIVWQSEIDNYLRGGQK